MITFRASGRGVALATLALLAAACSGATPPASYPAAVQEGQTAAYEALRAGNATSLGIALVTADRLVWAESFGVADAEAGTPPTPATMYGIGSVSKMFAAVAVLQLVEHGDVALDAPVADYVPGFRMAVPEANDVTVRMLLDHASGIPGTTFRDGFTSVAVPGYASEVVAALADERLAFRPGFMSVYCNDGFTLVEALVESVTGLSYAEYVQREILAPLGMVHSAYPLGPFPDGAYAKLYRGGAPMPQDYTNLLASGGLYTTPSDLGTFARVFLNRGTVDGVRVLTGSSVDAMAVDQTAGSFNPAPSLTVAYGLGWDSVAEPSLRAQGVDGWTKNGGTFFYAAQLLVAPREGLGVVVMGTSGDGFDPLAIAQRVLLRALAESGRIPSYPAPLPPVAAPEATPPDGLLASMAGVYAAHDRVVELRPEADGSVTMLTLGGDGFQPTRPGLRYRSDGWFTAADAPLLSYRTIEAGGSRYVVSRQPMGSKTYLDQLLVLQRVEGSGAGLSPRWQARVDRDLPGRTWLVVNESPASQLFLLGGPPQLTLETVPELPGLVLVVPSLVPAPLVLDPSQDDDVARMMLVIPGGGSRDMNDMDIVPRGGEEWVRWGSYLHRPAATVPVLPVGATTAVPIGAEGYAEWRRVAGAPADELVTISGATAWRAYDGSFAPVGAGGAQGRVVVPAGSGPLHLLLYGAPGGQVGVGVE